MSASDTRGQFTSPRGSRASVYRQGLRLLDWFWIGLIHIQPLQMSISMCSLSLAKIGHMVHSRDMVHMYTSGNNQLTSYMYVQRKTQPDTRN